MKSFIYKADSHHEMIFYIHVVCLRICSYKKNGSLSFNNSSSLNQKTLWFKSLFSLDSKGIKDIQLDKFAVLFRLVL